MNELKENEFDSAPLILNLETEERILKSKEVMD